jgi:hypothetical protein
MNGYSKRGVVISETTTHLNLVPNFYQAAHGNELQSFTPEAFIAFKLKSSQSNGLIRLKSH